jgi:hypothetical protein
MPPVSLEDKDPYVDDRYGKYSMGYEEVRTGIYENIVSMNWSNQFFDPGSAEFVRAFWTIQELPADALKCAWGDAYINSLNQADFSACGLIDPVYAVYLQCLNVITSVNDFLRNTTEDKLEERGCSGFVKKTVMQYRAEARFLRAYFYWVAMDVFGGRIVHRFQRLDGNPQSFQQAKSTGYCSGNVSYGSSAGIFDRISGKYRFRSDGFGPKDQPNEEEEYRGRKQHDADPPCDPPNLVQNMVHVHSSQNSTALS